jgi:hypothetical protein
MANLSLGLAFGGLWDHLKFLLAAFSVVGNPRRMSAYTPPVTSSLRPCILTILLRLERIYDYLHPGCIRLFLLAPGYWVLVSENTEFRIQNPEGKTLFAQKVSKSTFEIILIIRKAV